MKDHLVTIRVWGDFACFTRPEMKVERVSYPVMMPSAARGILETIFWESQIHYLIDTIHVIQRGRWFSFRRNEVINVISIDSAKTWMKSPEKISPIQAGGSAPDGTQRNMLALETIEYLITAEVHLTELGRKFGQTIQKYRAEIERRAKNGKCYHRPYLGVREFAADFDWETTRRRRSNGVRTNSAKMAKYLAGRRLGPSAVRRVRSRTARPRLPLAVRSRARRGEKDRAEMGRHDDQARSNLLSRAHRKRKARLPPAARPICAHHGGITMLLKLLYDFTHSRRLLDDLAFAPKAIRWVIPLNTDGNLIGAGPLETTGQKNRGKEYPSPQTSRPKNAGGIAEFLADNITGLFNLDPDPEKDKDNERKRKERNDNNAAKFEDFWGQIKTAFNETQHPALKVLLQFHERTKDSPPFLRWGVSKEPKPDEKPNWWLTTASGDEVRLGPDNFTFKVDGELLLDDEAKLRPFWRKIYQRRSTTKTLQQNVASASLPARAIC